MYRRHATAEHHQVRLRQVWLCARTFLPVSEPGGQTWHVPRVPVQRTFRHQHGTGLLTKFQLFIQ